MSRTTRLVGALAVMWFGTATLLLARQDPAASRPRFATASIEPGTPLGEFSFGGDDLVPFIREVRIGPGDRFEANTTLRRLVAYAYGVDGRWGQATGSDPLLDELFHVSGEGVAGSFDALTDDGQPAVRHLLRQLLAERFKLIVATVDETRRTMVIRRAATGSFGPKLKRVTGGCAKGSQAIADAQGLARCVWDQQGSRFRVVVEDFDQVAAWISKTGRLDVINETGLVGALAFETAFDPYTINPSGQGPLAADLAKVDPATARLASLQPHYLFEPSFEAAMKSDLDLVVSYEPRPIRVLSITHVEPLREKEP